MTLPLSLLGEESPVQAGLSKHPSATSSSVYCSHIFYVNPLPPDAREAAERYARSRELQPSNAFIPLPTFLCSDCSTRHRHRSLRCHRHGGKGRTRADTPQPRWGTGTALRGSYCYSSSKHHLLQLRKQSWFGGLGGWVFCGFFVWFGFCLFFSVCFFKLHISKPFPNRTQARTHPSTLSTINQRPPNGSPLLSLWFIRIPPSGASPLRVPARDLASCSSQRKMTSQHVRREPQPAISFTRTAAPSATRYGTGRFVPPSMGTIGPNR